jgi:hypothetical protein
MRSSSFLLLGLLFCLDAHAVPSRLEQRALDASSYLSQKIQAGAEYLDLALAGKKYTDDANTSQASVSQLVSLTEGGVWHNSTDIGLNLRLPNVEKHWQARFSTYDEEQEHRDMNQRIIRTTERPKDPGAALFFFRKLGNVKTTFQPRVELKNPLQVNYVLKFETDAAHKAFRLEPSAELFADSIKGTGQWVGMNFFLRPSARWEFTQQNEEEYHASLNTFSTRHGFTVDYALSDDKGLGWATVASSENHNFHLSNLNFALSYSQQVIPKLLKYSFSPFLGFAKADSFKGKFGVSLNILITI